MLFILLYLISLFIAPQLWIEPFIGLHVDLFIYPVWLGWIVLTGRTPELYRFRAQDMFFLAMLLWIVLSILVNGVRENSDKIIQDYFKWFILYRLVVASLPTFTDVRRTTLLLLGFGLILAVEGIQQMHSATGIGWAGQSFSWMDAEAAAAGVAGRTRWINLFDGPGVFCVVYTITLPFAMQYLSKPFPARHRLLAILLLAPLLLATYYTGSRGGFLATVGVFGLFILTKTNISPTRMLLVGMAMLGVLVLAPSYLTSTSDSHGSAQHRIDMWGEGIEMVQQNPVFGIGKGNFLSYTSRLIAHNSTIEVVGETGLPGLFFWLGIIYMGFKTLAAYYRESKDAIEQSYVLALGLSVAGHMISSIFVTLEYETFYFLLALTAAVGNSLNVKPSFSERDFWILSSIVVVSVIMLKGVVMVYY
jgi:O-antigen ligase